MLCVHRYRLPVCWYHVGSVFLHGLVANLHLQLDRRWRAHDLTEDTLKQSNNETCILWSVYSNLYWIQIYRSRPLLGLVLMSFFIHSNKQCDTDSPAASSLFIIIAFTHANKVYRVRSKTKRYLIASYGKLDDAKVFLIFKCYGIPSFINKIVPVQINAI